MAIIQISKTQQRTGNLVDLPQLDNGEFGLANDARRLFIGNESITYGTQNIEVLTSYSNVVFSQIEGAVGNLDIAANVANGEVLGFDGNNWVNKGGNAGGLITLGDVSNVKITGGSLGYVLETDGTGNLSFTPKGAVTAAISNVTQANPAVVTTTENNFFTDGSLVTITNVSGMTQLNGNSYYANVLTANTFSLYSDSALTSPVDSTGFGAYTGNGRAIASIGGAGSTAAGGANTTVQYNENNVLNGSASFTFDYNASPKLLTVVGNANVSNLNATTAVTATTLTGSLTTAAQPNVTSVGTLSSLSVSGTANVGTLRTTTITTGANTTAGTITGNWSLSSGSLLQSTYADLAEYYVADQQYVPGTVLQFGGDNEVTIAEDSTIKVAGVVSTKPSYIMNSECAGEHVVPIALQGRVPCKVRGKIRKGDMMISGGNGYARPSSSPMVGSVIGKALENFDGIEGVIEIAIGRL